MNYVGFITVFVIAVGLTPSAAVGQAPSVPRAGVELRSHLDSLARQLDDPTADMGARERIAVEMASTLDRAAHSAPTPDARRAFWSEAADVLDQFSKKNVGHPEASAFQVQSSVYVWARARDRLRAARLNPTDTADREAALADLNSCVERLRPIYQVVGNGAETFAQNVRFRLAQALADVAEVGGRNDKAVRDAANAQALAALGKAITEPSLQGFARLLRALLLARLGRFDEATVEADAAAACRPAPTPSEQVEARTEILVGKRDFAGALKSADRSLIDPSEKTLWRARVRLAECLALGNADDRNAAETVLFAELDALRRSGRPETRAELAAAAAVIREPGALQTPLAWDVLADGAAALGDSARAGALERKAAERAESRGQKPQAVASWLKAGAFLFQAEKFAEADPLLSKVADDPDAGPSRARASLLRALGRGRALALNRPGATLADYASALKFQIETFPNDPSSSEARWLLGKLRLAESDREAALTLWEAIPHGNPRWAESRAEIAAVRQRDLDLQRLNNDRPAVERRLTEARSFLARSLKEANGEIETNDVLLASARLELTPGLGRPEEARRLCEQVEKSVARADQRDQSRRLRLVALAALNRWFDAEQACRQEITLSEPAALLPTVRLLDRWAAESDSDVRTRRIGSFLRILLAPAQERLDAVAADRRVELRLRYARALLFNGDDQGARRVLSSGFAPDVSSSDDLLRDLADTFARLEAYDLSEDVQKLRSRRTTTGSIPWFDARYGLALAYYRAGKSKEALHLIDATTILHPDLGGGELRDKFLRLRQRIGSPQ